VVFDFLRHSDDHGVPSLPTNAHLIPIVSRDVRKEN